MEQVKRKVNGIFKVYPLYSESEAEIKNIPFVHWKEVEVGDYGISDDGFIGECIGRKTYTDKHKRTKTFVKMCYGANWISKNSKIIYIENKEHNSYASIKPRNWAEKELGKTRTKNLITAYVEQLLSNKPVDWDILGNIYRPDQKTPAATVRRLLKQEVVKDMVDKKLKEVLVNKGVTEEFVLDTMLEAIEIAKNKLDAGNLLKAADNLQDLLEMKPSKKVVTDTLEIGSSTKLLDEIEENESKMKLQRKTESPLDAEE